MALKSLGIALCLAGLLIAGIALGFDTTAPGADVYNLGKLQAQLLTFVAGSALFVAGVALAAAGEVLDTTRRGVNYLRRQLGDDGPAADVRIPAGYQPASASTPAASTPPSELTDEDVARLERERWSDLVGYSIAGVIVVVALIAWLMWAHA